METNTSEKPEETEGEDVYLYIYDLSRGLASMLSTTIIGKHIQGIWHTAIVVYGREYYFGGEGICVAQPGCVIGEPLEKKFLGKTYIPKELFCEYIDELSNTSFQGNKYNLFYHNCNNFSDCIANFLVGVGIPQHILHLPHEVLTSFVRRSVNTS